MERGREEGGGGGGGGRFALLLDWAVGDIYMSICSVCSCARVLVCSCACACVHQRVRVHKRVRVRVRVRVVGSSAGTDRLQSAAADCPYAGAVPRTHVRACRCLPACLCASVCVRTRRRARICRAGIAAVGRCSLLWRTEDKPCHGVEAKWGGSMRVSGETEMDR
jgi:hypothetical protein